MDGRELIAALENKAQRLSQQVWPRNRNLNDINKWIAAFDGVAGGVSAETIRLHCLYVLTHVVTFQDREFNELLRALYREYIRLPLVYEIRADHGGVVDPQVVEAEVHARLASTLFVGLGSAVKSGSHLLYQFTKQGQLSADQVVATSDDLLTTNVADPGAKLRRHGITRYVFIDDVCGTGLSALDQGPLLARLRELGKDSGVDPRIEILFLFGSASSLAGLTGTGGFDAAHALMLFDDTHKAFGTDSRYFQAQPGVASGLIVKATAEGLFRRAGDQLWASHPLGFMDSQLLLAFEYNTPDNTLTAIWSKGPDEGWSPIFERTQ